MSTIKNRVSEDDRRKKEVKFKLNIVLKQKRAIKYLSKKKSELV